MESSKRVFYHLYSPYPEEPYQVYGNPEWDEQFGLAEWSDRAVGLSAGRIALPIGITRVDLTIVLPSLNVGDFVWTWYSDCIVTDTTLALFKQAGFTGFEERPVTIERVEFVSKKRMREFGIPPLWELLIKGKGGDADPESGIHVIDQNDESGFPTYSSFRNGIIVDEANWDGSDFLTVNGYPKYVLVSERVKALIVSHGLTNCALIPSHKLEWSSDTRPEDWLDKKRAMTARNLESLLYDLEDPENTSLLNTIHALGFKGDPRAVDSLIKKFAHPDPLVWNPAACAVGEIYLHKDTSEHIRNEIFSKLSKLLDHINPLMRRSAATAFLEIGGDQAAEEVLRLFNDANDSLRDRGAFIIGRLHYKPALEAIRRLTRDHSKAVRKTARETLRELSSEFS